MRKGITFFAKSVVYLLILASLAVCFILLPELAREESVRDDGNLLVTSVFLLSSFIVASPFFIALYQTLKLLKNIETNKAFTDQSVRILRNIKRCAISFSILVVLAVVAGVGLAKTGDPTEDVTFMFTIGFLFTAVSGVLAVFVALLQKLLTDAVAMKSENDLIV